MFHVEFQSTSHPKMAQRMLEYNVHASITYEMPVHSFLIYLKKGKKKDEAFVTSPLIQLSAFGEEIHRFSYTVIKMWEVPTDLLLNAGYKGLLPLVPLTAEGMQHENVEQAITQLMPQGKKPEVELLASLGELGSLAYTKRTDKDWLRGRFRTMGNIFKDSWLYQEWKQEGREEGIQGSIMAIVRKYFPSLTTMAQECVARLKTSEQLQNLLLQIVGTQDEQKVRCYLLEAGKE